MLMDVPRAIARGTSGSQRLLRTVICSHRSTVSRHIFRRWIQISTFPGTSSQPDNLPINAAPLDVDDPDAKFEVLGAPYSLLSASLSASQTLYARRGTLVGLSGKAENVVSSLSTPEPFHRAVLGMPLFYQKVSSSSPVTALLSTKSPLTSFTVIHLDGTIDWMVIQRTAVLAWTGQTLSVSPTINPQLPIGHWGNSSVTGRGLLALVGNGQIYELVLGLGETYVAHPSNVLAYTMTRQRPMPYRFKSSVLKLEVPGIGGLARFLPDTRFFKEIRLSQTWRTLSNFFHNVRTWSRRTIYGDSLFLQFEGPATILLQTRASRISDVLTAREINEIADTPAGAVEDAVKSDIKKAANVNKLSMAPLPPTRSTVASVNPDGNVKFTEKASKVADKVQD